MSDNLDVTVPMLVKDGANANARRKNPEENENRCFFS
jgi:hypothetical protein